MINIKRSSTPPVDLMKGTKKNPSKADTELQAVIEFYSLEANLSETFDFKAYRAASVTEELGKLFFGKCAYCESRYHATQPMDVEHFRPKGGVMVIDRSPKRSSKKAGKKSSKKSSASEEPKFKLRKPGYYWLAASWDNLLPSCIYCNRPNKQKIPDETDPAKFKEIVLGKSNYFPLADENKRRLSHKSKKREEPLILDPTLDKPEEHLEFTEKGMVRPAAINGKPSLKGETSIRVYALQRNELILERRARALLVLGQIQNVRETINDLKQRPGDKQLEERLERKMAELKKYTEPEQPYAGMVRQIVNNFLASLR